MSFVAFVNINPANATLKYFIMDFSFQKTIDTNGLFSMNQNHRKTKKSHFNAIINIPHKRCFCYLQNEINSVKF